MQPILEGENFYITNRGKALETTRLEREKGFLGAITTRSDFNPQSAKEIVLGNQDPNRRYRTSQAVDINIVNKQISSRDLKISINRADQAIRIFNTGNHTHLLRQNNQANNLRHNTNISLSLNEPWSMRFSNTRIEIHNLPKQGRLVIGNTTDGEGKTLKPDANWLSLVEYEPVKTEEQAPTNSKHMRAFWQAFSAMQS